MTNNTETRLAEIEETLRQLTTKKPSAVRNLWNWCKPYIIPFVLGMIVGGLFVNVPISAIPVANRQTSILEHQAALGGAAIPFPSGSPSPSPSALPLIDWMEEPTDLSSTSISEEPSPNNPQADSGRTPSTRFYRLPLRRMR